jgi:hypothetical protein
MGFSPEDLAAAATNPARPKPKKKVGTTVGSVVVGVLVLFSAFKVLREDKALPIETQLAQAVATLQKQLPQEPSPGVVVEKVIAEKRDMVFVVRLKDVTQAQLATQGELIAQAQADEKAQLVSMCGDKNVRAILDAGANVVRRIVDTDRKLLFDARLTKADCPKAG